ncbi:ATPase, T2SS/T4P/T4SS family [Ramlibacter sp. AN1133]|uniref:ATPase, T2SS/T4P/T4SS family n=1 Tax=Ramlibacter sp. AN1133 TaxID=3133429 RepID=UPI0030C4AB8C
MLRKLFFPKLNVAAPGAGGRRVVATESRKPIGANIQQRAPANDAAQPAEAKQAPQGKTFAGIRFASDAEIETTHDLAQIQFFKVVNDEVKLGQHLYSRVAVAQTLANAKECILFADKHKATPDELTSVVTLLKNLGWALAGNGPQGYWLSSHLVMSLSQGHISADGMKSERDIARDSAKSALLASFMSIISWAYENNADDVDFAVDQQSPRSQIAFKIGGRYVRPERYLIATDTMVQMLGIAWQISRGGSDATFQTRTEQQARVELDLPPSKKMEKGARVRLRWSGMANDKGTVVTMRIQRLGDSARIRSLESAGYPRSQMDILRRVIHSEGGMVVFSGVVGSGKSTSLAQLLSMLPHDIKMISIEDPVELEILFMYQKTVTRDLQATGDDPAFVSAVRAIFRSALDVLLLGEIRDQTTGLLARQVAESGHTVYTTTHAKGALGVIDRFASPAIGIPREVLATPDILKVLVYQALLPVSCPHCATSPDDFAREHGLHGAELDAHQMYFERIHRLYDLDPGRFRLRNPKGCPHCRKEDLPELNGFAGRTVVSEMIEPDDNMLSFILRGDNVALTRYWRSLATGRFDDDNLVGKNAMECAIFKAQQGVIDPREIEPRFMAFETVEAKRKLMKELA